MSLKVMYESRGRGQTQPAEFGERLLSFPEWLRLEIIFLVLHDDQILKLQPLLDCGRVGTGTLLRIACIEHYHQVLGDVGVEVTVDAEVFVDTLHLGDVNLVAAAFEVH